MDGSSKIKLNAGGASISWGLHAVWLPSGSPVPFPGSAEGRGLEGKEIQWDCSNYSGITLLNIPGKVFAHILLRWICDHILRHQRPEQDEFTPSK